jgi:hypothetical protein
MHYAAIKYEIAGKPHSFYRRTHGPDTVSKPLNPNEWDKGPKCGSCDGFDAFELMCDCSAAVLRRAATYIRCNLLFVCRSDCWRSKQTNGAGNKIGDDFQIFSSEKDFFGRTSSGGIGGGWTSCNYDDCPTHVGYPRDCGPTTPVECECMMVSAGQQACPAPHLLISWVVGLDSLCWLGPADR